MSNIAGKSYAMNVLTPSPRRTRFSLLRLRLQWRATWINKLIFMASRGVPKLLDELLGLSLIHFARWAFIRPKDWPWFERGATDPRDRIRHDYMLFCSNFNGAWDQYIDAFSDGAPMRLDQAWYSAMGYPQSIPVSQFKRYITHNQFDTKYYYNAVPGAGQRDVKAALRVRREVLKLRDLHRRLADDATMDDGARDAAFSAAWRKALGAVQNDFGEHGYAPAASDDTARAELNRLALARKGG
ncbi:MAG: hypothetical protein ACFCUS_04130 [Rubrimonas sp.]|uniref:hypothetical protein n=1 Tax=Rubrimonas sp. TaxID=2036015 RepID=UPI002FDE14DE